VSDRNDSVSESLDAIRRSGVYGIHSRGVDAMRVELTKAGCTLYREDGDKAISHESTVGYHMKRLLNAQGHHFVRVNPSRHGLTSVQAGAR